MKIVAEILAFSDGLVGVVLAVLLPLFGVVTAWRPYFLGDRLFQEAVTTFPHPAISPK